MHYIEYTPPLPPHPSVLSFQYARYTCQVKSDDIDSDGVAGLQEKAVESGSDGALEALFADNEGVLSGVSVVGVEAEVMRDVYVVGSSSIGEFIVFFGGTDGGGWRRGCTVQPSWP